MWVTRENLKQLAHKDSVIVTLVGGGQYKGFFSSHSAKPSGQFARGMVRTEYTIYLENSLGNLLFCRDAQYIEPARIVLVEKWKSL